MTIRHAIDRMHERAQAVRARAAVRRWEYRQRHLASGTWFRLRRVLADAQAAFVISEADADHLRAEGYRSEPCGAEVSPPKALIFVDRARLTTLGSRREIRVGLGPDFLAATSIVLVRFDDTAR